MQIAELNQHPSFAGQTAQLWLYTPDQQAYYQRKGWQAVEQRHIAGEKVTVMMLRLAQ